MLEELVFEEFSAYFKVFYDFLIGVFYELTRVRSNGFDESAAIVYHLHERQIILSADVGVVFAERGGSGSQTAAPIAAKVLAACKTMLDTPNPNG